MKKAKRFTIVVLTVAVSLAATAVALYVIVPSRLASRSEDALAARARSAADYVAKNANVALSRRDSRELRRAAEIAQLEPDLAYAVIVGERNDVLATATEDVEVGQEWTKTLTDALFGGDIEHITTSVVVGESVPASVHLGLDRAALRANNKRDEQWLAGFAGFLILLALGAGFGVVQMERLRRQAQEWQQRHKSVRLQAGTLQSSVREHRQTERHLKQSESKYRSLFESTMASAMADLEELNKHLEKRKADLEHEVGVRKNAEQALRRYTERLQLLNEVERSLLENDPVTESARLALLRMADLVPVQTVCLVESDVRRGTAHIIGLTSRAETKRSVGDEVNFSGLPTKAEILEEADLSAKEELSGKERELLEEGVRCVVQVPLVVQDDVVGILTMEGSDPSAFSPEHHSIARDVADLLAIGIHRARLEGEREVYEQELILARDRAEDMARLKTAFLTNMSHEIRTPISGIMGFSQVLHEEVPAGLKEFTGLIRESAHRLLNTINSVLELARLESGKLGMEAVAMDLAEAAKGSAALLEPSARRKGLDFRVEMPSSAVWCYLDRACVERIVTNLIDNAIKFTDGGAVRVNLARSNGRARLSVSDTGVGIAEEFIPHLFDEFRQEQMEANREHEGSGLGLTITKKLVDRLGGTIQIESKKGVGTVVTVEFPLIHSDHEEEEEGKAPAGVVVITANPDAMDLVDRGVSGSFKCVRAMSSEEALQARDEIEVQAVMVDVNGIELEYLPGWLSQLRNAHPRARLFAFASQIIPSDVSAVVRLGFEGFIMEPFAEGALARSLAPDAPVGVRTARPVSGWGTQTSA